MWLILDTLKEEASGWLEVLQACHCTSVSSCSDQEDTDALIVQVFKTGYSIEELEAPEWIWRCFCFF